MVRDQVVIGSGMVATALGARRMRGTVVYAAGVSNSSCTRQSEFDRERERLKESMLHPGLFIYASTTSVEDKPYRHHKIGMESLVRERGDYLIVRMPIIAGKTTNPHTLLNFLYSRIQRSEEFDLYTKARRNIIDIADVASIVEWLVRNGARNETVNVAAPHDYGIQEVVSVFEVITGKHAVANRIDAGDWQHIDVRRISDADVDFSGDYLGRTLRRYFR